MDTITIDTIIRSKRKTLALEISRDARLIVRAPEKTPLAYIEKILQEKRFWIQKKQKAVRAKLKRCVPKEFVNGEEFLYCGDTYPLSIEDTHLPLTLDEKFRLSRQYLSEARSVFINWYKKEAYKKITERLAFYSNRTGLTYNKCTITHAQKRWGSCSAKKNLCFSWRLIMAPPRVLDYVVVHELVHSDVMNHSRRFWEKVKVIVPDYRSLEQWLKENEYLFII